MDMNEDTMDMIEDDSDSWEQFPAESAKAFSAFCVYRDMGPNRSLAKTAHTMNRPPGYKQTLWEWSTKYEWRSRCLDYDRHIEKVAQSEKENAIREMADRHARDAVKIQQMVMEALETTSLEAAPPRDLIRLWERAVRAERTSRGLPAEPTKANYVDYSDAVTDHYWDHERDRKDKKEKARLDDLLSL
jgi:hypothetical protein